MKRIENLLNLVADHENLRFAAWKAAKGKRYTEEVHAYFSKIDENILKLHQQILSDDIDVGNYRYFTVYEPKERQICASAFSEQVLHHALINICPPIFEKWQIFDSYASRKNKGTYAALAQAKAFSRSEQWFLKMDIRKFFASVHHDVLKAQLAKMFKDERLLAIFSKIIDSFEASPSRGLPIGNLTSQYFANHYLAALDHFIKERLQIKHYVRYMDDMVLWHSDKEVLKKAYLAIDEFIQNELKCALKPIVLNKIEFGLPFLGYHIFPFHTRLLQKSKQRFLRKVKIVQVHYDKGTWSEAKCQRRILPLLAYANHADTNILKKNLLLRLDGQSP
jgi:RNA-directed DNA polymerase